nr:uncharacterized protein C12orf60 homolog [Microcebus murinus]XP_012609192.1 uncharacterized protein C12orf60 homolog [Microcebus murinus]XP_012609193.1 uncharacterized protein C12orf60 homolog [Microcebus murinus]XP_012609194.1 uncharacterized protein C12orf60 homolog [Microcebus murinus]XP_012609195.1 uncharacterized protein C12orf60 homolog [Microcebus murinus]
MSSESENDKERLVQAAKTFFFHIKDLTFFTNTLTELFNNNMNTQILSMAVKDNSTIKDSFEHMLRIFKDMQSVVKEKYNEMQKESLCSKFASAMCSMVEKSTNVKELQESAKEVFKNVHTPVIVSVLHNGNILGNLESSLSLLMTLPIMNLQLSDFYREDNKEQSEATTSQKTKSPGPTKAMSPGLSKPMSPGLSKPTSPGLSKPTSPAPSKPTSPGPSKPASPGPSKPTSPAPSKPTSPGPSKPASPGPSNPTSPGPSKPTSPSPSKPTSPGPSKPTSPGPSKTTSPGPSKATSPGPTQTTSPGPSRATVVDILKKLQDALKPKNANNPTESAADLLEQIVKDMGPILEILQKVTNSIETDISMSFKKVNDK